MKKSHVIYDRLCRHSGVTPIFMEDEGGLILGIGAGLCMVVLDQIHLPVQSVVDMSGGLSGDSWNTAYGMAEVLFPTWVVLAGWLTITRPQKILGAIDKFGVYAPTVAYIRPKFGFPEGITESRSLREIPIMLGATLASRRLGSTVDFLDLE